MRVFYGEEGLPPFDGAAVTVGSFDGVHLGHKQLLGVTAAEAARKGVPSVAVTFSPHPRKVLKKDERTWLLTTTEEKLSLIASTGIGNTIVLPFTEEFSRMDSGLFVERFIIGRLHAGTMVVGYDHRFGHNKAGDYATLSRDPHGLVVTRVEEMTARGVKISSTSARQVVGEGRMDAAARVLGHNYFAEATAVPSPEGTLLVLPDHDKLMPPDGEYPVEIRLPGLREPMSAALTIKSGRYTLSPSLSAGEGMTVRVEFL